MIAGALPIALAVSLGSYAMGVWLPSFALAYLLGAHLLTSLGLCAVSFSLLGLRDQRGRWFTWTLAATGLVGILSWLWLIIENLGLGLSSVFPVTFLVIDSVGNAALIIGLAAISIGQHRRRAGRFVGYLLLSLVFVACVFVVYQANVTGNPPVLLALGLGGRVLLSFFSAVFAWSFLSSEKPPLDVVGRAPRLVLVATLVLQLIARTLFAFQYAGLHTAVPSFFLVGSPSDVLSLFADCVLLIAGLVLLAQVAELTSAAQPSIIRHGAVTRTILLTTLVTGVLVTATTALALVGRVLPVFLSEADVLLALHTIAGGLALGVIIVLLTIGLAALAMTRLTTRPIQQLSGLVTEATQTGFTSYREPRNLVFAELRSVSDGYSQLLDALKRTRSQLRAPDPFARREPGGPPAALAVDFYSAVLEYQASKTSETISRNAQALAHAANNKGDASSRLNDVITATAQLQDTLRILQTLRQVDAGEIPEVSSKDLGNILRQVVEETKERFGGRVIRISLQLSEPHCRILANDLASDIFTSILRCIVRNDASQEVVIDLVVDQVQEQETTYWQTVITSYGWIVPNEQRDALFQRNAAQAQRAAPGLILAKALTEALHGALRTGNEVPYDQRYGTVFFVLLPAVMQDQASKLRMMRGEPNY